MPPESVHETAPDLIRLSRGAADAAAGVLVEATAAVRARVVKDGRVVQRLLDREQRATHALAWLATYVEALRQLADYARRIGAAGRLGEIERLIVEIGLGEYLAQIEGGIPMSQGEIVRPADMGLSAAAVAQRLQGAAAFMSGNARRRERLVELMAACRDGCVGDCGLDETLAAIRQRMRKFAEREVAPRAQAWHRANRYIPLDLITQMSALGVFGLTIAEEYGASASAGNRCAWSPRSWPAAIWGWARSERAPRSQPS
jgi:(2S)-methylsuccinyl-CoA dehydrogenase